MKIDFAPTDTLAQARQKLAAAFTAAGKEAAGLESRLFLQAATGLTPLALATCADGSLLDQASAALLRDYAARRVAGEPVSRILGRSGFYGLNLHVAPDVLDPRADTETLVNAALGLLDATKATQPRILDLGVGSGAILCALLDARSDAFGVGVDFSPAACALTRKNLAHCGLSERSAVVRGDWADALGGRFDLIVSNPPYIFIRKSRRWSLRSEPSIRCWRWTVAWTVSILTAESRRTCPGSCVPAARPVSKSVGARARK